MGVLGLEAVFSLINTWKVFLYSNLRLLSQQYYTYCISISYHILYNYGGEMASNPDIKIRIICRIQYF